MEYVRKKPYEDAPTIKCPYCDRVLFSPENYYSTPCKHYIGAILDNEIYNGFGDEFDHLLGILEWENEENNKKVRKLIKKQFIIDINDFTVEQIIENRSNTKIIVDASEYGYMGEGGFIYHYFSDDYKKFIEVLNTLSDIIKNTEE